jgi:predicted PurR-regulated permease PerM
MIPNVQIRQVLFLLLIAGLVGLLIWNLLFFIPALLGAYTLYVLLQKPLAYLIDARKWNKKAAIASVMLVTFIIILLPFAGLAGLLSNKIREGVQTQAETRRSLEKVITKLEKRIGFQVITPERIDVVSNWGVSQASTMVNATLGGLVKLLITFFILWFMLSCSKEIEHSFFSWLPLKPVNIEFLRKELNDNVFSNAIGIPLMGLVQGAVGGIGYSLAGVHDLWFWVFMTFVTGMIPFLGVSLTFIPLAVLLYSEGQNGIATFILIYGLLVIGSVDNIARMWLLKKIGDTHPLITLFGVIVGLKLFGFVGFIFGPILIEVCLLLLKIYTKEFNNKSTTEKV